MSNEQRVGREIGEWRRLRAVELDHMGWLEVDIATALGVNKGTVSKWLGVAKAEGTEALRAHPSAGHPPKLTPEQSQRIPEFLLYGAEAYGFRGEVWTCPRIAQVIRWEFGVSYHKDHVSRMMKDLGWTPQVPNTRAVQRDEVAIERWRKQTWPELRHKGQPRAPNLGFYRRIGLLSVAGSGPNLRTERTDARDRQVVDSRPFVRDGRFHT